MTYCPLDLIENYLQRYVAYPSEHAVVAHTLWIAHCHLIEEFDTTPRLAFMSGEKRSGKTRALEVTAPLVPNAELFFSPSPAAMVRLINSGSYVVMTDEIDGIFGRDKSTDGAIDLRTALNSGYKRGATYPRCKPNTLEVERLKAFAPVAVAGIGSLPDTLADRAVIITMRRRMRSEFVETFRHRYAADVAGPIREELAQWCEGVRLPEDPKLPVEDRAAEIWEPLIQVADAAGGDWPSRARNAAVFFTNANAEYEARTDGVDLLEHIRDAFIGADKIWTSTLLRRLVERDESPWADIHGRSLDARGLGKRLFPYRVKSRDVKIDGIVRKGFHRSDFNDLWASYLDNQLSATSATSATKLNSKSKKVAEVAEVAANRTDLEERAAILEFDAGLPRAQAEAQAAAEFDGWADMPEGLRRWDGQPKLKVIGGTDRGAA